MFRPLLVAVLLCLLPLSARAVPHRDGAEPHAHHAKKSSSGQRSAHGSHRTASAKRHGAHHHASGRAHAQRDAGPPQPRRTELVGESAPAAPASVEAPADPRLVDMQQAIESVLHERPLSRSRVGVEVVTAADGKVLFSWNGDRLFNPASNTKLLTTAAALSELGADFRYRTGVYGPAPDGDGIVHGDIELRGSGDPSLNTGDLAELARDIAEQGVKQIDGSIVSDGRFHDGQNGGRPVGEQAIILNRNTYAVRVIPTSEKHAPIVEVDPPMDLVVHDRAVTVSSRRKSRLRVDVSRDDGKTVVTVRGRISNRSDVVIKKRVGDTSQLAAALFRRALVDFGVDVSGTVKPGYVPSATLLAEHRSAPLAQICRVSNKESNNFVADTIFKTLGGERYGLPGTLAKGRDAVAELMTKLGVPDDAYRIVNGSGLTHENRIAPASIIRLLRYLYFDMAVAPEFISSLAIGGVDGTIRHRFSGTGAVHLVRAKTGTLAGVSALSGYVGETNDVLIFSIFVEGFRHSRIRDVRHAQDRMVLAMLHYLRANNAVEAPKPADAAPDVDDGEDDADPDSSAGGQ